MNQRIADGKLIVSMVGSTMREGNLVVNVKQARDWEKIYLLARHFQVGDLVYLSMLGTDLPVPVDIHKLFFLQYIASLRYNEIEDSSENGILDYFNQRGLETTVISSSRIRKLYPREENGGCTPLVLLLSQENFFLAKGYLVDMGYSLDKSFPHCGERMSAPDGFIVELYYDLPFFTRELVKVTESLLSQAVRDPQRPLIRFLAEEDRFLLKWMKACWDYCRAELSLRMMLDIFILYQTYTDQANTARVNMKHCLQILKQAKVEALAMRILSISEMWFGHYEGKDLTKADFEIFDKMEKRILSGDNEYDNPIPEAAHLLSEIQLSQEKRNQERKGIIDQILFVLHVTAIHFADVIHWILPGYRDMCREYPILTSIPLLLPIFWGIRGVNLILKSAYHNNI
ncbi:hypothetical protein ACTNEN_02390 [Oribacterium sp. HCP28S3_H8]|uniref:hypothetical protein n=1 Tax=Oribacterium sp. HCP28S3_H8 TaxID=3438945 RepID=UPI003F8ABA1C